MPPSSNTQTQARKKGVALEFTFESPHDQVFIGDGPRIQQILTNLADNGVHACYGWVCTRAHEWLAIPPPAYSATPPPDNYGAHEHRLTYASLSTRERSGIDLLRREGG